MSSLFESLRFRMHVRNLLYDYVKQHCTVDYLTFTEGLVSEFFEDLKSVPLADPYTLTLPVDPFDTLEKIYSELSYSPVDHDVLQISQETASYLKEVVKADAGKSKTDIIVMSDSYGPPPPEEPCYPALSRRARQSTKKLGSGDVQQPRTLKELFEEHNLAVLEVETFQERNVDLEDTLKIKISIDLEEEPALKSLLQSTLTLRPEKPYTNRYLDSTFLCSQFPSEPSYTPTEDVFIPIFPRKRHIGATATTNSEITDFRSLLENVSAPFEPAKVADLDYDNLRQNLVLVDGWQAIRSSPPSTPSQKARSDDETDELDDIRFPSSPYTTPPMMHELEESKMHQILIPRSRRIGGKDGITPHILRGKTLKTFLTPLLSQPRTEKEGSGAERVPSPAPSSLIGQPPSCLDIDHDIETEADGYLDFDVGIEIQKLCEGYELEPDFFFHETIDDKAAFFMEVPTLPLPNEFPKDFFVPKSFSDFVIPSVAKRGPPNVDISSFRFLKKVKGCQSLSLALSWVPFTTDKQLPTLLEILDVVDLFPLEGGAEYTQALEFLDSVAAEPSSDCLAEVSVRRGLEAGPEDLLYEPPSEAFHIMLARKDRSCLDKPDGSTSVASKVHNVDAGGPSDVSDFSTNIGRPLKKLKRCSQDKRHFLNLGPPVDYQTLADDERGSVAGDDVTVLSDKRGMVWSSYSTSLSHHGDLNHEQHLLRSPFQKFTSDDSLSPARAGAADKRYLEGPSLHLDSRRDVQDAGIDDVASRSSGRQSSCVPANLGPSCNPELAMHSLGSFTFAQLRARKVSVPQPESAPVPDLDPMTHPRAVERTDLRRGPPPEVCDDKTIYLTESIIPQSIHKYMASVELLQKGALVRALRSRDCAVELVDRRDLAGVDLILDTDTAVVFLNLFPLPARCDVCVDKIAKGSWKYDKILVVFEAYDELSAKKTKRHRPSLLASGPTVSCSTLKYAYTPPIVKALKKLKRGLSIAEGCGTKRIATVIQYAYADTVEEAALFARLYGDWCEANDRTHGAIWGDRAWLDADILEDEEANLASLNGMNHFSASIILCQVSLEQFIDLLPEERVSAFGPFVLADRIRECNQDLAARFAAVERDRFSNLAK